MARDARRQLERAKRARVLVRFGRPFEPGHVLGYVRATGPAHFLVAVIGEKLVPNGFQAFRIRDVRHLDVPHANAGFVEESLRLRGERVPRTPRVRLDGFPALLRSAGRLYPLVTIFRERVDPASCWIGRVLDVDDRRVRLLEIDPSASWEPDPSEYRIPEITRVDFGGGYEEALALVEASRRSARRKRSPARS